MIVTLDELKTKFGFSFPAAKSDVYQSYLNLAEEACLSYAGLEEGTVTEIFDGGSRSFVLTHGPILSISSVKVSDAESPYRFEKRSGSIILPSVPEGTDAVEIKYECGWEEGKAPYLLKAAVAFSMQHIAKLNEAKLVGINSRTTEGGTESIDQSVPPLAAQKILARFKQVIL